MILYIIDCKYIIHMVPNPCVCNTNIVCTDDNT